MQTHGAIQLARNLGKFASDNSPTILTGLAGAGVFTTTIFGIMATPKAIAAIDKYKANQVFDEFMQEDEDLSAREIMEVTWKFYISTIVMGLTTVGCIIGANHISLRRNAALASLYSITEVAFKEYQEKVVETIGKNKELKIRDEISGDRLKNNPIGKNEIIITGRGNVVCYDSSSGRYFKSDIEKLRQAAQRLNKFMSRDNFVSLNDWYYEIGLSGVSFGGLSGWNQDHEIDITFTAKLDENDDPCLVLDYLNEPIPKYRPKTDMDY